MARCRRGVVGEKGKWGVVMEKGKGVRKWKGSANVKDKCRKDSGSSVGSRVGSLENYWGKKREREEEGADTSEEMGGGI